MTLNVSAQQPWTLQQCIDQALKHNIQIKQSALSNDLNKVQVNQNVASMFPSINGNASQNYYYGRSIDPYTNAFTTQEVRSNSFSISGNIPLFEGLQLQNNLKESKLNYLASQNDLKKIQNDISLNVVSYFLQVMYNEDLLKTTLEQMKSSAYQRDRMKRMYELGSMSRGNYLDLESQYATDELKYIQAQSQYDQSLLSLTQLLELDTMKNFKIIRPDINLPLVDSTQINTDPIFEAALTTQPDIKSSEYKLRGAEKNLSSARGALYPRLFLSGSVSTNYSTSSKDITYLQLPPERTFAGMTNSGDSVYTFIPNSVPVFSDTPFRDQIDNNLGKSVGFSLQIPLFNGWMARSNIARSKINLEQYRLNNELTRKNLYKSVQQAVADALAASKKLVASQRSLDALQETFNYSQQRMDLGEISTFDYLISKNNFANAEANLLQSKYDYVFRIKVLDFYQGKPLTF